MRRADKRTYHFIYRTTCQTTGKWYIGMHSADSLDDGYLGSGKVLWFSLRKYGKENHTREILEFLPSRKQLAIREKELVTEQIRTDPMCMNIADGGLGGYTAEMWRRRRAPLECRLNQQINSIELSREQMISMLVDANGHLRKNASKCICRHRSGLLTGNSQHAVLRKRERLVAAKWAYISEQLNLAFPHSDDVVEQINAFVHGISSRPTCKMCQNPTTFFRFGKPYATYCGSKCQLLDPLTINPIMKRWNKVCPVSF